MNLVGEDNETKAVKYPWPKSLPQQAQAVRNAVASFDYPVESKEIAQRFANARVTAITELLQTLELLGQVHIIEGKGYTV